MTIKKRSTFRRRDIRRRCMHCGRVFHPWTDIGRFCSRACAAGFKSDAYWAAIAERTDELSVAILRGQERARAYRASPEFSELQRATASDLARVERALGLEVTL